MSDDRWKLCTYLQTKKPRRKGGVFLLNLVAGGRNTRCLRASSVRLAQTIDVQEIAAQAEVLLEKLGLFEALYLAKA